LKDFPKMLIKIKDTVWQDFFIDQAQKLSKKVIE